MDFLRMNSTTGYFISFLISIFSPMLLIIWYIRNTGKRDAFLFHEINLKIWILSFLLCISIFLLLIAFKGRPIMVMHKNEIPYLIYLLGPLLCSPVIEEIIFRGLLLKQLLLKIIPWISIVITSILFALPHFSSFERILNALLCGIVLGFIYYKTDKLVVCILFHSLFNVLTSITGFINNYSLTLQISSFILAITLSIFAIRGFCKNRYIENK